MIPKEMIEAAAKAILDRRTRRDFFAATGDLQDGTLAWKFDHDKELAEAALAAALSSARKTGLVLCSMPGGIHEGTCPACGCQPLPSPPEEKAE